MENWLKAIFALAVCALGFSAFGGQKHPRVVPESGFISPEKYTNAFLGFSVPLPQDLPYHVLIPSPPPKREPLLTLESDDGRAGLKILASPSPEVLGRCEWNAPCTDIGGTTFSRQVFHRKVGSETLWTITYQARVYNYSLVFSIDALDEGAAKKLERCVQGTKFFEPSKAQQVAGPDSRPFDPLLLGQSAHH